MFTGLVETIGDIKNISKETTGMKLVVSADKNFFTGVKKGDSIAVNGVCLTAENINETNFSAYASNETLTVSTFDSFRIGDKVNLEKPMTPSSFFGGHIVQGHVDTKGIVKESKKNGNGYDIVISVSDKKDMNFIVEKGSISVDGTSLTVNELFSDGFRLTVIPHTFDNTIMKYYKIGKVVNLEFDIIAKYVYKMINKKDSDNKINEMVINSPYFK